MTEKRGGGYAVVVSAVQGDTDREVSRVESVKSELREGDLGVSKVKFSSKSIVNGAC